MKLTQSHWKEGSPWLPALTPNPSAQLVLLFGSTALFKDKAPFKELRSAYPKAMLAGCTTAGEIFGSRVLDDSLVATAVEFEKTRLSAVYASVSGPQDSQKAGEELGNKLEKKDLAHVFLLSDGLSINGTDLVKGLLKHLPEGVTATGGLSGDGARFQETLVLDEKGTPQRNLVTAIGMYGRALKVGYASLGGWDSFGPERTVTRSEGNVLYELDGRSALELYKQYLGEHAKGLPATGLLFPLSLRTGENESAVVRTILAVNETEQSMTFAGTLPQGARTRFMKANFDRLIDGASGAAKTSYAAVGSSTPELAVLISCVGRKLILKQRIEEEVEGVREVLGPKAVLAGFYSYGEISPFTPGAKCELHNQTMTITTFSET
jgi:hypothetical protein